MKEKQHGTYGRTGCESALPDIRRLNKHQLSADAERLITLNELAERLRVHPTTLYRLVREHADIPFIRIGGQYRFRLSAVMAALEEHNGKWSSQAPPPGRQT